MNRTRDDDNNGDLRTIRKGGGGRMVENMPRPKRKGGGETSLCGLGGGGQ